MTNCPNWEIGDLLYYLTPLVPIRPASPARRATSCLRKEAIVIGLLKYDLAILCGTWCLSLTYHSLSLARKAFFPDQ